MTIIQHHRPLVPGIATFWMLVVFFLKPVDLSSAPNFWDEIPPSPSTTAPAEIKDDYWNGEFQRVTREVSLAKECKLVFFGDSITWSWSLGKAVGQNVWKEHYSRYNPINMGNSGDITPVMLFRVTHGNLDFSEDKQPKVAVMLCGINNFGVTQSAGGKEKWDLGIDCPPADIANGRRAIAQAFRRRLPKTRVIMMALLPVADKHKWARCQQVNAINAADQYNSNEVAYVDLHEQFLMPDGSINKALFKDGLHPNEDGYRVWAKGIESIVQKFMEAPPLNPVKIMLIGGSITEGRNSSSSYRRYLDGMLRRSGCLVDFVGSRKKHNDDRTEPDSYQYDVDHEGHWGKDAAWMADNLPRLLNGNVPDVAVLELGTGEISASKSGAESDLDKIVDNIHRMIDALRSKNPKVKILLASALPVTGKKEATDLFNKKLLLLASSNPQSVVMAQTGRDFDGERDMGDDGLMPTPDGAKKFAVALADAFNSIVTLSSPVEKIPAK